MVVLVIAVLYHLRDEFDCQYNANNTGDDTLVFSRSARTIFGIWLQWIAYDMRNQSTVGNVCRIYRISAVMCH